MRKLSSNPAREASELLEVPTPSVSSQNRGLLVFTLLFLVGIIVIMVAIPGSAYMPITEVKASQAKDAIYSSSSHTTMLLPTRLVALLSWSALTCLSFLGYVFLKSRKRR